MKLLFDQKHKLACLFEIWRKTETNRVHERDPFKYVQENALNVITFLNNNNLLNHKEIIKLITKE